MNPLSPFAYYRRHGRRAVMLVALLALAVAGLYLVIGLLQETYVSPIYTMNRYLRKFSLLQADVGQTLDPAIAGRIRAHPDVAQALRQNNVELSVPNIGGTYFSFRLIGLQPADVAAVLARCRVTLVAGRLPQPDSNGLALSRELATALELEIGDTLDQSKDGAIYANIVSPLKLVGIFSGDVRLGIVSYDYLAGDERYRERAGSGLLVIPRPGREAAVDRFLRAAAGSAGATAYTYGLVRDKAVRDSAVLYRVGVPLVLLLAAAITLVVSAINRLAFMRRLPEFGTLHAAGYRKEWLARRLALEMAGLALAGWTLGVLLACGAMAILSAAVYAPRGFGYNPLEPIALAYVLPVPLAVIGFTLLTAVRALRRMDAVAIVERGELSLEGERPGGSRHGHSLSLSRPLAAATFYRRHARQAAVLVGAMALMIVSTALLVFILEVFDHARQPMLTHLRRMSLVSPQAGPLDPAAVADIRTHPAAERVIPAYVFSALGIAIPPVTPNYPGETYGLSPDDLAYLVEAQGLKLAEGHLPRPNTNDIVIPWTFAQNRHLELGDVIGSSAHPAYRDAPVLPSELVVSGIFAPARAFADETWLSFVSLDFVEQHRDAWKGELSLIVVPRPGQQAALDGWLENQVAGQRSLVLTYGNQQALFRKQARTLLFVLSLLEAVVALVAAVALAGLNYIFIAQRQAELGILSALGFGRAPLVWRIARESLLTTGAAWLLAMLACAAILLYLHYGIYIPAGLKLNLTNLTPWLYTLPVPVAVLAVSAGSVGRTLSRLDPVSIIERRA